MAKFKISGVEKVVGKLQAKSAAAGRANVAVAVGFATKYALWVHERTAMKLAGQPRPGNRGFYWDPQGMAKAKFLQDPARTLQPELARIVRHLLKMAAPMSQALFVAGLRLQRAAQLQTPVDTGVLKASAFTRYL